jgi:alpha-galactosidase
MYRIGIHPSGVLIHLYWGRKIVIEQPERLLHVRERAFSPAYRDYGADVSLDSLPQEYPTKGIGDFRDPAIEVVCKDGSNILELTYHSHRIMAGKPALAGLPATYIEHEDEADTLEIDLHDQRTSIVVTLRYTAYRERNVVTRSAIIKNNGNTPVSLRRALSSSIDFYDQTFKLIHLSGTWSRERSLAFETLGSGVFSIESTRGTSSHQANPFLALASPDVGEEHGEVFATNLVYSGNFVFRVKKNAVGGARFIAGINPDTFGWKLNPGENFVTPEAIHVYSSSGLTAMTHTFHDLYRERLCRGEYRDRERPILVNNWEATYFSFDRATLLRLSSVAAQLGLELFVLDDGWFGSRDDDKQSLGDWVANEKKLAGTLKSLATEVQQAGVKFGLWVEPEMVSPNSDLFRAHPEWCLQVPGAYKTESRNQLVLDLSRADVCAYLVQVLSNLFESAPISYVKWDMNRSLTNVWSELLPADQQNEVGHRYVLGLYSVLEQLTTKFPQILFEGCSGGGGRFDPGMLHYTPQIWASDNTDAISRLNIQFGTSFIYPPSAMTAHVSAVPNHQVHRITSMQCRGDVAMAGNFGYELDLTKLSDDECREITSQVESYKQLRHLVQFGHFYRLITPAFDSSDSAAWCYVAPDKTRAYATFVQIFAVSNSPLRRLKLRGLLPSGRYSLVGTDLRFSGEELMFVGIEIQELKGDYQTQTFEFRLMADA